MRFGDHDARDPALRVGRSARYPCRARYPRVELEPRMKTVRTISELRRALEPLRGESTVGLVPTMGALHAGHEALFRAARSECGVVVASVFVNPAQFSEAADLDRYPRDLEADERRAAAAGVDVVFAPPVEEFYPE